MPSIPPIVSGQIALTVNSLTINPPGMQNTLGATMMVTRQPDSSLVTFTIAPPAPPQTLTVAGPKDAVVQITFTLTNPDFKPGIELSLIGIFFSNASAAISTIFPAYIVNTSATAINYPPGGETAWTVSIPAESITVYDIITLCDAPFTLLFVDNMSNLYVFDPGVVNDPSVQHATRHRRK